MNQVGRDAGRGNILALHPNLEADDYRSEAAFRRKLEEPIRAARSAGVIGKKTVALFPEMVGFYLIAVDEADAVFRAPTLSDAAVYIGMAHGDDVDPPRFRVEPALQMRRAIFEHKAVRMAEAYQSAFAHLARRFKVTIAAGTTVLPGPRVKGGRLEVRLDEPARNVGAVFAPDGSMYPDLVVKSFPTREEESELGVVRGIPDDLPVFHTPAGVLGVIICADSWFPETYRTLRRKGSTILVVESRLGDSAAMGGQWPGYDLSTGLETPADVNPADPGRLTNGQAWNKYALPGRIRTDAGSDSPFTVGVNVFLRGRLWEFQTPGAWPLVVRRDQSHSFPPDRPVPDFVNVWIP